MSVCVQSSLAWYCPLQLALGIWFLYLLLGWRYVDVLPLESIDTDLT